MAKYKDVIDLYDDYGKLLKSNVALERVSPLVNPAVKKIIDDTKRSVAVSIGGMQEGLKSGKIGKHQQILGRELDLPIVENIDAIEEKIREYVSVEEGDDTEIRRFNGGKLLLIKVPTARIESAATYDASLMAVAAATTYAIVEHFQVDMFNANTVKAAAFGSYPVTMDLSGGACSMIMSIPQNNESLGYALRNIPANQVVMMTHKNAMQGAALASTFEHAGQFEMGNAIGPFERAQLLLYAYQGLNANNIVYDIVRENGKTGTVGTVVQSLTERAIEDRVIRQTPAAPGGYFKPYETKDPMMWNAYASAGTLAATMVNAGAGRIAQAASSTLLYFNDLLEHETGLPGSDFGRVMGAGVGFSFFSHSIYGGGGPGIFNGNHVVTRHAAGVAMPCTVSACALDGGTQMFSPEGTAKIYGDTFGSIEEFARPIQAIASGA